MDAKFFEVTMSEDGKLSSEGLEALRMRFQAHSRKAQAYYTVMHQVREIVGNDDAANAWMNQSLPALGGKTPAELVNEVQEEAVLSHIASMNI